MTIQNKYDKQIEIIDLVSNSLKSNNADEFFRVRDGLYFAFFKSSYDLKDDFKELFPYEKATLVYNALNSVQKAGGFSYDELFGAGGSIKINDALNVFKYIKEILTKAKDSPNNNGGDGNSNNDNNGNVPPGNINSSNVNDLPLLLRDLLSVCIKMQRNPFHSKLGVSENQRNTYIRDGMEYLEYKVDDQTLQGVSAKGKGPGELDLLIEEKDTKIEIVVEGLNLTGLNKAYIENHFDRVFGYDTFGNKYNVELVYCNVKDLDDMKNKYYDTVINFKSATNPADAIDEIETPGSRLFILRSHQLINKKDNYIFHFLIQLL